MKKYLIILGLLIITSGVAGAQQFQNTTNDRQAPPPPPQMSAEDRAAKEAEFEQKLGLTDEQKQQAKKLRLDDREKMKPVMDKLRACEQEAMTVRNSSLTEQQKSEKLNAINNDIKTYHKQLHEMRRANMTSFENILTTEQRQILKNMRQEGRKEFQKKHNIDKLNTQTK